MTVSIEALINMNISIAPFMSECLDQVVQYISVKTRELKGKEDSKRVPNVVRKQPETTQPPSPEFTAPDAAPHRRNKARKTFREIRKVSSCPPSKVRARPKDISTILRAVDQSM